MPNSEQKPGVVGWGCAIILLVGLVYGGLKLLGWVLRFLIF